MSQAKATSHFLKLLFILLGLGIVGFMLTILPILASEVARESPVLDYLVVPMLVVCYVLAIVFLVAEGAAIYLLVLIDQDKIFSRRANSLFSFIKVCAGIDTIILVGIFAYLSVNKILGPPMFIMLTPLIFIGAIITLFVALLQHILKEVIRIKTENELTV